MYNYQPETDLFNRDKSKFDLIFILVFIVVMGYIIIFEKRVP